MTKGLVTFMFDDGNVSDYTIMKPVFDAKKEVAVSAIVTDWIGKDGFMTLSQILELQNAGWEIASHTKSHHSLLILTETEIREELKNSKIILEKYGFIINNFVYPYHRQNDIIRNITKEYYRSARGKLGLNPSILDNYLLSSVSVNDNNNLNMINVTESEKRWMIFYAHSTNSSDINNFNKLIDYIQLKNISIVTMNQALDLIGEK